MNNSRTFRIFVSSTFSDLKAERNALQERVFPRLRDLVVAHGCRFQAIDLRWGVSEEAALDQQTMKICLGEVERCQKVSPRPNFIVLLGDRYGWMPLPYEIPIEEFDRIFPLIPEAERALVADWYRQDSNAVPNPVYVLLTRTGKYKEYETWEPVEHRLHTLLATAAMQAGLAEGALVKYTTSATEQEILQGAFHVVEKDHIFCFAREVEWLPQDDRVRGFIDLAGNEPDLQAGGRLSTLKRRLKEVLGGGYHEYAARWEESGPSLEHLDRLCEDVYRGLEQVILREVATLEQVDLLEKEIATHQEFSLERATLFIGRAIILKQMDGYVRSSNPQPLAVWGPSGSGKSALMAKTAQEAQKSLPHASILQRFISVTPDSSSGRSLLGSLCQQITRLYGGDESTLPFSYNDLAAEFPLRLGLATAENPLVIFLDALDQLSDADHARSLAWLPAELPPHVRLVVTTLPGECLEALRKKIPDENRLELLSMPLEEGAALFDLWMDGAGRTLRPDQRGDILGKYERCGLPLYLKLAFEEARRWRSYDGLPKGADNIPGLGEDIPDILRDLFWRLSQESNHGKLLVGRSLGYLAAAKNGLSEDEMLDVLSADTEVLKNFHDRSPKSPKVKRLPAVIWSRLYYDLEPYLVERAVDGTTLLTFYHPSTFGKAVTEIYLAGEEKIAQHRKLAVYFGSQSLERERGGEKTINLRKTSEQVFQQRYGEMWGELRATLTDFDFLKAKVTGFGPQPLIEDYDLATVSTVEVSAEVVRSLSLIQGALRLSAQIIMYDLNQLASQLAGRLLGFEHDDIHRLLAQIRQVETHPWLRPLTASLTAPGGSLEASTRIDIDLLSKNKAAVSADGSRLLYVDRRSMTVWDLSTHSKLRVLESHDDNLALATVSLDGSLAVLSASLNDNIVKPLVLWDLERGIKLGLLSQDEGLLAALSLTASGTRAVSIGGLDSDLLIKVWDLTSRTSVVVIRGVLCQVNGAAITPDGRWAVIGSGGYVRVSAEDIEMKDTKVTLWDLERGIKAWELEREQPVQAVAITPDARLVLFREENASQIIVYDWRNAQELYKLNGDGPIAISRDARYAIAGSRSAQAWDLETGELAGSHEDCGGKVIVATENAGQIVSICDNTVKLWKIGVTEAMSASPRHAAPVTAVSFRHRKNTALSLSQDGMLCFWDLLKGIPARKLNLPRHEKAVISTDGELTGLVDEKCLLVYDVESGECVSEFKGQRKFSAFACTGRSGHMALGSYFGDLKILRTDDLAELHNIPAKASMDGLAVTPDGKCAVTTAEDRLFIWDLEVRKLIYTAHDFLGETRTSDRSVRALKITPDGRYVVLASGDEVLRVWCLRTGSLVYALQGHGNEIQNVLLTPDGSRIVSCSYRQICVWETATGKLIHSLYDSHANIGAVITDDGSRLLTWEVRTIYHEHSREARPITVWDLQTGESLHSMEAHADSVTGIVVTPDGKRAASSSEDGIVNIWNLETAECIHTLLTAPGQAVRPNGSRLSSGRRLVGDCGGGSHAIFSSDGSLLIVSLSTTALGVCNAKTGDLIRILEQNEGCTEIFTVTLDGGGFVISCGTDVAYVWDLNTGILLHRLQHPKGWIQNIILTPDGLRLITSSEYAEAVWNLADGSLIHSMVGSIFGEYTLREGRALTVDGKHLVTGSHMHMLRVWDIASGNLSFKLEPEGVSGFNALAIDPGNRYVGSASRDIKIWGIVSGKCEHVLKGDGEKFTALSFTEDGTHLVSSGAGGSHEIRVWDIASGQPVTGIRECVGSTILSMVVTMDGVLAFCGYEDSTIRAWNLSNLQLLATFTGYSAMTSVDVASDGCTVVAGEQSGRVHFLRLEDKGGSCE